MRRAPLALALLAVLLLAVAAIAWFALQRGPTDAALAPHAGIARVSDEGAGSVRAPDAQAPKPELPELPEGTRPAAEARAAVVSAAGDRAPGERVVHGRVELPLDCRREDALTVYALARAATVDELAAALFRERHGDRPRAGEEDGADADPPAAPAPSELVLARAAVEADGRFELRLAGTLEKVHLGAVGRLAYMADTRAVTLGAPRVEVSLGLSCGAAVAGVLVPPQGESLEALEGTDVRVRVAALGRAGRSLSRAARADARGRFVVGGLPARVDLELLATPESHPYARLELGRLEAGQGHEVRVELARGARVIGVVVDDGGRPVPGARVAYVPEGSLFDLDWASRTGRCDDEGRFDLSGLRPGRMMLRGTARGFLESEFTKLEVEEAGTRSGVELRLSSGSAIAGRVSWPDGRPAVDARIRVRFDPANALGMGGFSAMRGAKGEGTTDAQGLFRVGGLGRGPFVVRIEASPPDDLAQQDGEPWLAFLGSMPPDGPELEVVLSAPEGVVGRVVDVEQTPIERFHMVAIKLGSTSGIEMGIEDIGRDFEDAEGHFRFSGLPPGKWRFFATAEGFARGGPVTLDIPRPPDAEPAHFVLERSARAQGIVLGFDGRPVGEAEVSLVDDQPAFMRLMSVGPPLPTDRTDAGGRFQLEGLPPGELSLIARAEGYAPSAPRVLSVAAGHDVSGIEIVLREGGRILGEVYSAGGARASGVTVQLLNVSDMSWRFERTDGEGRFSATRLEPGSWRVLHMPRGFGTDSFSSADSKELDMGGLMQDMAVAMADVKDGETTHVVLGAPPEEPVRLSGRVLLAGDAYPGALLTFYREGTKALERMRATSSKDDGSFELVLDAPGQHLVQVQKMGSTGGEQTSVELIVDVPAASEHTLVLELPGGRISGRLAAPPGETPSGARVTLVGSGPQASGFFFGGSYSETTADADGRYEIVGLREGTYDLAVGGMAGGGLFGNEARFARELRQVALRADEHARDVDFRLRVPGRLAVRVVDEVGDPVADAAIFVRQAQTGTPLERFSLLTTGAQGTVEYGGLLEGRYTLSARKGVRASAESPPVQVRMEEVATVQLVLEEGTLLRLELIDESGEPLRAHYSVRDADGREHQGLFAMEDLMEILGKVALAWNQPQVGPLPPGEYTVSARSADGRQASRPVSLRGQRERTLRLRLR